MGQQRHLGCDGGAPLLGFSVSLWSLALKPLHRGDGGMQGIGAPFLPIPNVSSTSGESVASSVSAASEHREGAALILLSYISTFYLSTSNTKHLQATREVRAALHESLSSAARCLYGRQDHCRRHGPGACSTARKATSQARRTSRRASVITAACASTKATTKAAHITLASSSSKQRSPS